MSTGWVSPEEVMQVRRRTGGDTEFRRQIIGEWAPTKHRCDMHGKFDRCPNEARFMITSGEAVNHAYICDQCIVPWMMSIRPGVTIIVVRL